MYPLEIFVLRIAIATGAVAGFFWLAWLVSPNISDLRPYKLEPSKVEIFAGRADNRARTRLPNVGEEVRTLQEQYQWDRSREQRQFHYAFDVSTDTYPLYYLYSPGVGGHASVYLNRIPVGGTTRDRASGFGGNSRILFGTPSVNAILAGRNTIDVVTIEDTAWFGVKSIYYAPRAKTLDFRAAHNNWAALIQTFPLLIAASIAFSSAGFLGISRLRQKVLPIMALAYIVVAAALMSTPLVSAALGSWVMNLEAGLSIAAVGLATMIIGETSSKSGWVTKSSTRFFQGLLVVTLLVILCPRDWSLLSSFFIVVCATTLTLVSTYWLISINVPNAAHSNIAVGAGFIALASSVLSIKRLVSGPELEVSFLQSTVIQTGYLPFLIVGFAKIAFIAVKRMKHDGALQVELDATTNALLEETRKRILLEERGRLTRDVHDGIGGQLLSLLVRVRSGAVTQSEVERDLKAGLDDLRLIVDSLDSSDDDLNVALQSFKARIIPLLAADKIELTWNVAENDLKTIKLGTRATLSIYRILQEAVTNIIRHANANRVFISAATTSDTNNVVISIADDGFDTNRVTDGRVKGKGLRNMKKRALDLKGTFEFKSNAPNRGSTCHFTFPIPQAQD